MLFADASPGALALFPLIFMIAAGFIIGELIGLIPYFLARWKQRPGMASLALLFCGVAGALFAPLALPVAVVFSVAALAMGRWDPTRETRPKATGVQNARMEDAFRPAAAVGLTSARFLKQ